MNTCLACISFPRIRLSRRLGQILRSLPLGLLLLSAVHLCSAQRMGAPSKSHTSQAAVQLHRPGLQLLSISTGRSRTHGWRSLFTDGGGSAPHHGEAFHPGDGLPLNEALSLYKRVRGFRHVAALPRRQNVSFLANGAAVPARGVRGSFVSASYAAMEPGNPRRKLLQRLGNALPDWLAW